MQPVQIMYSSILNLAIKYHSFLSTKNILLYFYVGFQQEWRVHVSHVSLANTLKNENIQMVHLYSNAGEPYRESASLTSSKQTITELLATSFKLTFRVCQRQTMQFRLQGRTTCMTFQAKMLTEVRLLTRCLFLCWLLPQRASCFSRF